MVRPDQFSWNFGPPDQNFRDRPIRGKMVLVIVDARSTWLEVLTVSAAKSQSTIEKLRSIFATHGLPEVLVSDNGTPFTSTEFAAFTEVNGIKHLRSTAYHPTSNGLAERAVQTLKAAIKKLGSGCPWNRRSLVLCSSIA